jgi:hypothetical protein
MGWIADAPDFDSKRGVALLKRYRDLRHLLIGAWYPLTPYTRDPAKWIGEQFHRPDLNEGMVLVFRHAKATEDSIMVTLHGLDAEKPYELKFDVAGKTERHTGSELMKGLRVALPNGPSSALITYRVTP